MAADLDHLGMIATLRGDAKACHTFWTEAIALYRVLGWMPAVKRLSASLHEGIDTP
jgi:hypothetical protein